MSLLAPALLVEVLSESTRDYDRGAKLEHYKAIPSLRHVLLVESTARRVERHHRMEGGAWTLTVRTEGAIGLDDLGGSIPLDDVYLPDDR